MALGLEYRVEPELDERSAEKEAEKFSSTLDEKISELNPLESDDMFGDSMMDYMEDMQDMTEEFGEFNVEGEMGDFGADIIARQEPTQIGGREPSEETDGFRENILRQLEEIQEINRSIKSRGSSTASATGLLSRLFLGGLAGITVGGLALDFIENIMNSLAQQSPMLESVMGILGMALGLFFRPFGNILAQLLLPIATTLLELATTFNQVAEGEGIASAFAYLFDRFIDALFSLDGLFVSALTGAATVIGGAIGFKVGAIASAKLGAVIGGTIGSIIPGGGTAIGAGIGATLGLIAGLLFSLLIAFNVDLNEKIDGVITYLQNIFDGPLRFLRNIFLFVGLLYLEYLKLREDINEYLSSLLETFKEGGFSAVIEKILEDTGLDEVIGQFIDDKIPEINWQAVYNDIVDLVPSIPKVNWSELYSDIAGLVPNIPRVNWSNLYSRIAGLVPTIPSINWNNIYDGIVAKFPDVPTFSWDNYIPEVNFDISGFDWGEFIPTLSFNLPDFPGWEDVVTGAADTVGEVIEEFENIGKGIQPEPIVPPDDDGPYEDPALDDDGDGRGNRPPDDDDPGIGGGGGGDDDGQPGSRDPDRNEGRDDGDSFVGLASGGIVTDAMMAMVGEGSETEVVQPLSRLERFVDSQRSIENSINVDNADDVSQGDLEDAFERALSRADITDNEDVTTELQKVRTEIRRMRDEMDINVEFKDSSKWEVTK